MQLRYTVLFLLCLIIGFSVSSYPVLASAEFNSSYSEESMESRDSAVKKNILEPFRILWKFCTTSNVRIGGISFSFAEFWLYQILLIILIWFIKYLLYD